MAAVTLLTSPAIMGFCHLLVTLRRGAGRINNIISLDVHDGSTHRKEVSLVRHAKLGIFNVVDCSHLVAVDWPAWRRQPRLSMRLERCLGTSIHIPPFQSVRLRNIRTNNQRSRTEKGQGHSWCRTKLDRFANLESHLPLKSLTRTPLHAMTESRGVLNCSACFPHKVSRTEKSVLSTTISSRFCACKPASVKMYPLHYLRKNKPFYCSL